MVVTFLKTNTVTCLWLSLSIFLLFSVSMASAQVPTNGLMAWYPFNCGASDASGNGNHGVIKKQTHIKILETNSPTLFVPFYRVNVLCQYKCGKRQNVCILILIRNDMQQNCGNLFIPVEECSILSRAL